MYKQIKKITNRQLKENIAGLKAVDAFHTEYGFEPFLVFTEFYMSKPIFGPHPHAGVSVMTYMLPDSKGSFLNRDSDGDKSIIEPGGIHVTQAGSGIHHDETPTVLGVDCHGFQIWINHADKDRLVAPRAFHASAKDVPEYKTKNSHIRVVQGQYNGLQSPIELVTKTTLLDVTLQPNTTIELDTMEMALVYLIDGEIKIADQDISSKAFINFEKDGDKIILHSKNKAAHFLFLSGKPHKEPIVHGGPFVMTTKQQMLETQQRLQRGEMGVLNPL
ncbi:pirin family protein [Runella sp. SP2]|uniref:pirin family protein n=1 Tax=Runella sp. SP2 TaxID=2268026 RepID=UPI000F09629C|nr:pirin-like C-terminal cupin domain-containing protein [Runella sp. SP2]AYQ33596.1 pirin family protein [Runella sp. SP2]